MTSIGQEAFGRDYALTSVTLGASVSYVKTGAFSPKGSVTYPKTIYVQKSQAEAEALLAGKVGAEYQETKIVSYVSQQELGEKLNLSAVVHEWRPNESYIPVLDEEGGLDLDHGDVVIGYNGDLWTCISAVAES